jgi:hypothetical protein
MFLPSNRRYSFIIEGAIMQVFSIVSFLNLSYDEIWDS